MTLRPTVRHPICHKAQLTHKTAACVASRFLPQPSFIRENSLVKGVGGLCLSTVCDHKEHPLLPNQWTEYFWRKKIELFNKLEFFHEGKYFQQKPVIFLEFDVSKSRFEFRLLLLFYVYRKFSTCTWGFNISSSFQWLLQLVHPVFTMYKRNPHFTILAAGVQLTCSCACFWHWDEWYA